MEADRGHSAEAAALIEQAEKLNPQPGEAHTTDFFAMCKAKIAITQDQLTDADRLLTAHTAQLRAQGVPWTLALTLAVHGGRAALLLGEHARADRLLRESVLISARLRDLWGMMHQLTGLANTAALRCDPHRAATLYGAADALSEQTGATIMPVAQEFTRRCQQTATTATAPTR